MSLKTICPNLSTSELKSLSHKTNLLLNFIYGKEKSKETFVINKRGQKRMAGVRPIKPVKIFNKPYGSMSIASRALGIPVGTISRRCSSNRYEDRNYCFIETPTHK